jgi:ABC-2 type transport system permease protein
VPIHDQSYRRYKGARESARSAWTVIASSGILGLVRKRSFIGLLIFAWIPFIVRAVQIYVSANFPQAAILAMKPETFRQFFEQQGIFVFFVTIWVGAGLIANDRKANALQIYLSKPLTRAEYIAGKMAVLVTFLLLVTWLPAILLLILQVLFAGNFAFLVEHVYLVPAITLFSLVQVLVASFTMLALSSLSNSTRFVAVMYTGIVLFTEAMFNVLRGITGSSATSWLSFPASLNQVGDLIFRVPLRYDTPVVVSAVVLLALVVVSTSVLERKVRGVEVVT